MFLLLNTGIGRSAGFPCLIEPFVVVDASTAIEGVLASVDVRKGDRIERGQVLATLRSDIEQAMVKHAEARVGMMSQIRAREVSHKRHRAKYRRALKLSTNNFLSADELDELESAVDLAFHELEAAKENKRLAEIELSRIQAQLDEHYIRSPIDGVVVERFLNPGEFAQAKPLVRIAQLDPLNVEAILPARVYGTVAEGQLARVTIPVPLDRVIDAPVVIVEKVIDAASGTFGVRVELPNPDYALPSGLECTVEFLEPTPNDAQDE